MFNRAMVVILAMLLMGGTVVCMRAIRRLNPERYAPANEGRQFSLRRLFLWLTCIAMLCGAYVGFGSLVQKADYAAQKAAYGNGRFTREEAEAIAGRSLENMPDEEFRVTSD